MNKEILNIEFRYHDDPRKGFCECQSKTVTIGIYDTLAEAVIEGNRVLVVLSKSFEVRPEDKFKVVGLFGCPDRLVSNCCYPTKGVSYFAKITTLSFDDVEGVVGETFKSFERYRLYKREVEN